MYDFMFAAFLIAQPVNTPIPPSFKTAAPLMREVAACMELMTYDHTWMMNPNRSEFSFDDDLNSLRQRWHEVKNAPVASDVHRFPTVAAIDGWVEFNRNYKAWLEKMAEVYPSHFDLIQDTIAETERLYSAWYYIRYAKNHNGHWCRYYLDMARRVVGEHWYWSGNWPWVPDWRMER